MTEQADNKTRSLSANDLSMLLVVLIWGANFSIIKRAIQDFPPLAFTGLRFALGTALLLLILRAREGWVRLPSRIWWHLLWLGLVGNTLYQALFVYGLKLTTAANGSLLVATSPVMVPLLGALFKIERVTRQVALGIALAFAGMFVVIAARGVSVSRATLVGDLLMLASALCWSVYTLGVRSLGAHVSTLRLTALTLLTGTPGLLILGAPQIANLNWNALGWQAWAGFAYAVLLGLVVAYALWNLSVRRVGGNRTVIFSCAVPLVAALVAWPVLGERPQSYHAVGAALIIGGVLLARRKGASPREAAPAHSSSAPAEVEAHVTG